MLGLASILLCLFHYTKHDSSATAKSPVMQSSPPQPVVGMVFLCMLPRKSPAELQPQCSGRME